ncbi:MAG: HupE/UreJ family protein [Acidobacteriaceae bacterium]|nr:HupE/UreJ family protein [Acidobacteriaceae bacterium]
MNTRLAVIAALLSLASPAFGHRLDEYVQAIIVSIESGRIQASMRLIPGVAVSGTVIAVADSNHDGVFSDAEQKAYADGVLRDLVLMDDGRRLNPVLQSVTFPLAADIQAGTGEIQIQFAADLPSRGGTQRTLVVENHHRPAMSVYLMNCLVPQDPGIRVTAQSRNQNQSFYRIDYTQSSPPGSSPPASLWSSFWISQLLPALSPFAGVPEMFRLGMRHIAEGADHLLFLLVLLLPAPLSAIRHRWAAAGSVRHSLIQIVKVVSAFTVGHSVTLALGAWGIVSMPARIVEILIAVSILVSAIHAWRALFPGREPAIAAFFGLIHGLAFASTLQNLGIGAWQRLASIMGFNFGIETMQLVVVAAILPSLILLSRTFAYGVFRRAGALIGGFAAAGWLAERVLGAHLYMDELAASVASRGGWIALALAIVSALIWLRQNFSARGDSQCSQEADQVKSAIDQQLAI